MILIPTCILHPSAGNTADQRIRYLTRVTRDARETSTAVYNYLFALIFLEGEKRGRDAEKRPETVGKKGGEEDGLMKFLAIEVRKGVEGCGGVWMV